MKHRAAAILACLSLVTAGAIVLPAGTPASTASARDAALAAPVQAVQPLPGGELPSLPDREPRRVIPTGAAEGDLGRVDGEVGNGALATVVDALTRDRELPADLADKVRVDGDRVRVEVTFTNETAARAALDRADGTDVAVITDGLLAVSVPADEIANLDADLAVDGVSLPAFSTPAPEQRIEIVPATVGSNGGDVYSKTQMSRWHQRGLSGRGISVGIIDYFDQSTWRSAQATKDVPAAAGTFCQWGGRSCSVFSSPSPDRHGVAVAEAIHDMAPNAKLYLATVATNEDLKKAIDYFAKKGVKIISRSLGGFYDGPGNGTGASAKLVDYAVSKGMAWFNSAGNSGAYAVSSGSDKLLVGGYWRGAWRDTNNNGWMEFAHYPLDANGAPTGEVFYYETMYVYCSPYFRLRWNDWGSSKTDYDIFRINPDGSVMSPGYSPNKQTKSGVAPLELQNGSDDYFRCDTNPSEDGWIEVGIRKIANGNGTSDDILELAGNSADILYTASSAGSAGEAFIDSKNKGLAAVGAVDPVQGVAIAGYSSQGPTNDRRVKPEISAGSNFTSRAYASQGGRFNGTSAATPVVAGAAAVVLERFDGMKPAALIDYLRKNQTVDRGVAGIDNVFGSGELVMKDLAVARFTATPAPKITGTRAVGSKLTVTTKWTPAVKSASYQWYRGSKAIAGATKSTYVLTKADAGKKIRVLVTGKRPAFTEVKKYSGWTIAIAKVFTKKPGPKVTGTAKVGRTLTAKPGSWSPKPSKIAYQWKANGKAIKGATKKTYKIKSADRGKRITVTVKVSKKGYLTTSKTSGKTAKVKR